MPHHAISGPLQPASVSSKAIVVALLLLFGAAAQCQAATHTFRGDWADPTLWRTLLVNTVPGYQPQDTVRVLQNAVAVMTAADRQREAEDQAARAIALMGGIDQSGIGAALYTDQTLYLHRNAATQVVVDKSGLGIPYNNYLYAAEQSLVVFNAANIGGGVLFQGDGRTRALIDPSYLLVTNAVEGRDIAVLRDFVYVEGIHYWADNLHFSNRMFNGSTLVDTSYDIQIQRSSAASAFAGMGGGAARLVDIVFADGVNDTDHGNAGIRYVSRATDQLYGDTGGFAAAAAIESLGQLGSVAGVQTTSWDISRTFSGLMLARPPLLAADGPPLLAADCLPSRAADCGFSVWTTPYYTHASADGMKAGIIANKFSSEYGGAALGGEFASSGTFRAGLALTAGTGHSKTKGPFRKTTSDFDFWGVGGYADVLLDRFVLTGDIGFTGTAHDVRQFLDPAMAMGNLKSKVDTGAFSSGLTGGCRFTLLDGGLEITPRTGARFTTLRTRGSSVHTTANDTLSRIGAANQHIWTFPAAVTVTGFIETAGGWSVRPLADVGVIFAAGDTGVRSRARISGTAYQSTFRSEVVDKAAFSGTLGVQARARNGLDLRAEYSIQSSRNLSRHQFGFTVGYRW